MAANDWIRVRHANTGGEATMTQRAVDTWARAKGWQPVDETTEEPAPAASTTASSGHTSTTSAPDSTATVGELRDWALDKDPDNAEAIAAMTKSEIRQRYDA